MEMQLYNLRGWAPELGCLPRFRGGSSSTELAGPKETAGHRLAGFPATLTYPQLVTRVSTARIRRRPPQTRNGAAPATPSYSLVPPGGFENSPRGKLVARVSTVRIRHSIPEEPGTMAVPGSINLWCPRRIRTVDTRATGSMLKQVGHVEGEPNKVALM